MDGAESDDPKVLSSILDVASYDLLVDLTAGEETFRSRTELRFRCRQDGTTVFANLDAGVVRRLVLNRTDLTDRALHRDGRLELPGVAGDNVLVVEADFPYVRNGRGLNRMPALEGGIECVYSNANIGGAARIFCCFNQPDLRAPLTLTVRAPAGWRCRANFPAVTEPRDTDSGLWRFAATPPLAPYLLALCAGPAEGTIFATVIDDDRALPVTIWTPAATAELPDTDLLVELARRPLRYYRQALAIPYPYPKCDLVFVPEFRALAFSPPGLATLQARLLDQTAANPPLYLACVLAHELAHAWFGGMIDMRHESEMWMQEALATYLSRTALEETQPGSTPWAPTTSESLPDHAYAEDAGLLRELEQLIGRRALLGGVAEVMRGHAHSTITVDDLVAAWSRTGGRDLHRWAAETLVPRGQAASAATE